MKTKTIFSTLILMLVIISSQALAASSSSSTNTAIINIDLINQDPDPADAGSLVELKLSIENTGGDTVEDLHIELLEEYPITIPTGEAQVKEISTLYAYQDGDDAQTIKYKVLIDKNAASGSYDLQFKYYENDPASYRIVEIPIEIDTGEQLEIISIDTTEIAPGEEKDITFTIKNVGTASVSDINFEFESEDDSILPVAGDNTQHIPVLETGQTVSVTYKVIADTTVNAGLNKITLTSSFEKEDGTTKEVKTSAGIYIGGTTDFDVAFASESNGEISLSIANIGSNPAYSVAVKIPSQNSWVTTGSNAEIIGNLNNGDYTVVSYDLSQKENAPLQVLVEYTDTRGYRQATTKEVDFGSTTNIQNNTNIPPNVRATGQKAAGMKGPMGGVGSAITTIKTYATYAGIAIIILAVLYFGYKKFKKEPKRRRK